MDESTGTQSGSRRGVGDALAQTPRQMTIDERLSARRSLAAGKNRMASDFQGKVVLITGGTRGIGRALALQLADEGALLALNYMSRAADADQVISEIEARGTRAVAVAAGGERIRAGRQREGEACSSSKGDGVAGRRAAAEDQGLHGRHVVWPQ